MLSKASLLNATSLSMHATHEELSYLTDQLYSSNSSVTTALENGKCHVYVFNKDSKTAFSLDQLAAKVYEIAEESKKRSTLLEGVPNPYEWQSVVERIKDLYENAVEVATQTSPVAPLFAEHVGAFQNGSIQEEFNTHNNQLIEYAFNIYANKLEEAVNEAIANKQTTLDIDKDRFMEEIPKRLTYWASFTYHIQIGAHMVLEDKFKEKNISVNFNRLTNCGANGRTISIKYPVEENKPSAG